MGRWPGLADASASRAVAALASAKGADILHGHGAKGGAYARLAAKLVRFQGQSVAAFYTPHGGSFNYKPGTARHSIWVEKSARNTDIFLFESAYIGRCFEPRSVRRGLKPRPRYQGRQAQTLPVEPPADAVDFLYVGELRRPRGSIPHRALAEVGRRRGRNPRALLVGTGPERGAAPAAELPRPVTSAFQVACRREAFTRGRILVVPSRAEIAALYRDRGRRRPDSDDRHRCRRDSGDFRPLSRSARSLRRCAGGSPMQCCANSTVTKSATPPRRGEELAAFVTAAVFDHHMVDAVIDGYRAALAAKGAGKDIAARAIRVSS